MTDQWIVGYLGLAVAAVLGWHSSYRWYRLQQRTMQDLKEAQAALGDALAGWQQTTTKLEESNALAARLGELVYGPRIESERQA